MSNVVTCTECQKSFRMRDELAGKRARCPHCKTLLQMPDLPARQENQPAVRQQTQQRTNRAPSRPASSPQVRPEQPAAAPSHPAEPALVRPTPVQPAAVQPTPATKPTTPRPRPKAPAKPKSVQPAGLRQVAPTPESRRELVQRILGGFQGSIESIELPWSYHFGILLVAWAMIMVPIFYVLIIGVVGYLVYLHAVHDVGMLGAGTGRGAAMVLIAYLAPMVAGGLLLLFMIKPLFAKPAKPHGTRSITPQSDPLLFAFVERVCTAVGAPMPTRIDVDTDVNAAAGFRRGLLSMIGRSDLVLRIGLPLVAGLNTRQFAGVLAHEFGHFTQGAGMRLTYLIRGISYWLTRVVYERDRWDEWLDRTARSLDIRLGLVLHLTRFCIWLTRRILWVLMMAGHAVSGYMLRQMEFDADRFEARLAGSSTFESTARQLLVLNVATQGAHADLREFYKEGRLGDNLPKLIIANVGQIPADLRKKLNEMIDESETGLLDTHPADSERIASARRENTPGIFQVEEPASVLFTDFDRLSKEVTFDFYRNVFGPEFESSSMHPVDSLLARQDEQQAAGKALGRYFQGAFTPLRPLVVRADELGPPTDPRRCLERLKEARQFAGEDGPRRAKSAKRYDDLDTRLVEIVQAVALLQANFTIRTNDFSIPLTSPGSAENARAQTLGQMDGLGLGLADFEEAMARRMVSSIQLLHVPKVAARLSHAGDWLQECPRLVAALTVLNEQHAELLELRNSRAALAILLNNLEGNQENEMLGMGIHNETKAILQRVLRIRHALTKAPYPFDHAKGPTTIGEYLLPGGLEENNLVAIYEAGGAILENLSGLMVRIVGRLAAIGEQVESALGLPPLADPPEEEPAGEGQTG